MAKKYKIGIDIGGTKMSAVLFDGEKVIADFILATPKDTLDHFLVMIKALAEPLIEKAKNENAEIENIGLGIAGAIDAKKEIVLNSPNIQIIKNVKLRHRIENMLSFPLKMDNDVNCFLRAEKSLGVVKNFYNVYGVIIGTGIGGAWWRDGAIYNGFYGGAGEVGNMVVDNGSGLNLEEIYHKITQNNPKHLAGEAYSGDMLAEKLFIELGTYLGIAFANIINILDPQAIVVGGGAVESSDLFFSQVKKIMKANISSSESAKNIKVLKSKLGQNAGAIGAALL